MRRTLTLAGAAGLVLAGVMMYIAWQHNPQGEFHSAGRVEWGPWLSLGAIWFMLPFTVGCICAALLWFNREGR